ncbi:MAG: hypothetical protein ATN34_05155 [Epulopiscium sp. Nele67-Bin002]|nr:MAG: hypothetical protein ATN34_05155 [Epulopiscium sp. Nele67-Bin002]
MSIVKPFKAIRPNTDLASKVASHPYDVMNEKEARKMVEGNPYSYLHVDRSEVSMPEGVDVHSPQVYQQACDNLKKMLKEQVLIQDETENFYIYKLADANTSQLGIVCCTSVDEASENKIKKHEFTRPEKEDDRVNHIDYCNANTSPVFLTYKTQAEIDHVINDYIKKNTPEYDFKTEDGVSHTVWVIDDSGVCNSLVRLFKGVECLYIADGHHRNASAIRVANMRREKAGDYSGEEEFNFYLSVLFPHTQLKIYDYNRVVTDLNGLSPQEFFDKIEENFTLEQSAGNKAYRPANKYEYGMYLDTNWYVLKAKPQVIPDDIIGKLDVSVLQNSLLAPVLGINDPRTDKRIDFVGGIRGLEGLMDKVDSGEFKVAFSLFAPSMDELLEVADNGYVMPPKSTWFEPKLRSGLFVHSLS